MNPKTKESVSIDDVVAQLIESLPAEARAAKHDALTGSAHKLRAVVKVCDQALTELADVVLWKYNKRLPHRDWPTPKGGQDLVIEAQKHFDPLVTACVELIRAETAQVNGLASLPFVLGLFDTRRISVLTSVRFQLAGGLVPPPAALATSIAE
jgi:hypothetical protein